MAKILLWLVAVGLVALALWQASEAIWGSAGRVIVVVSGLIIIGVGVARVVKGVKRSFAEEIDTSSMSPVARNGVAQLGQIGYIAKGVALGVVVGLLSYATLTFDRQKQGRDGTRPARRTDGGKGASASGSSPGE